ncbi:hypothetical protein Tco_1115726, partial [Tanacetum coccineum]
MVTDEKINTGDEALSVSVKKHTVSLQVDNLKLNSEGIFSLCVDEEFEDSSVVVADSEVISNLSEAVEFEENLEVDEKNDTCISEALNDSVKEQNDYSRVDNPKAEAEVISKLCEDADFKDVLEAVEKNDFK